MITKLKAWFSKFWSWCLGVGAFVLGVFGLWRLDRYRRRNLGVLRDELAFERAKAEIKSLRRVREEVEREVGQTDTAIERVDEEIVRNKRKLIESFENGHGLSNEEVLREFADLGI